MQNDNEHEVVFLPKAKKDKWRIAIIVAVACIVFGSLFSFLHIQKSATHVHDNQTIAGVYNTPNVAIVFGGGIGVNGPLPLLQDRLDTAKQLHDDGIVQKIILSGDNRFLNYNEPQAMYEYLLGRGLSEDVLQQDLAGRSTYETCERAKKIFSVERAILVSESTHLPRAIFLCRQFGIEAYGVKSDGEASSGLQAGQRWREVLARNKAIFNVYLIGENTVLGDPIDLELN